jgi:hypothetical protein
MALVRRVQAFSHSESPEMATGNAETERQAVHWQCGGAVVQSAKCKVACASVHMIPGPVRDSGPAAQ